MRRYYLEIDGIELTFQPPYNKDLYTVLKVQSVDSTRMSTITLGGLTNTLILNTNTGAATTRPTSEQLLRLYPTGVPFYVLKRMGRHPLFIAGKNVYKFDKDVEKFLYMSRIIDRKET